MTDTMEWEATDIDKFKKDSFTTEDENVTSGNKLMEMIMEMEIDYQEGNLRKKQIVVVPDTNIFIHSMEVIRELLGGDYSEESNSYASVVLAWTVLQELDGLRKVKREAQVAINYINELLVNKHPRLTGQKPSEVASSKEKFQGSNQDDSILQCVLFLCEKVVGGVVVFVTNDKNLRNKSLIMGQNNLLICDGDSALEKIDTELGRNARSTNKHKKLSSSKSVWTVSKLKPKCEVVPKVSELTTVRPTTEISRKRRSSIRNLNSEQKPLHFSPLRKRTPKSVIIFKSCDNFSEIMTMLRDTISYIIQFQMKEDFGENWLKCLKIPPPWTLETGLKCIILHWIAVFSFVFGRTKESAERLHEAVKKHNRENRANSKLQTMTELEEEILELSIALFNAAELNKSQLVHESEIIHCKQALLGYLKKAKESRD